MNIFNLLLQLLFPLQLRHLGGEAFA